MPAATSGLDHPAPDGLLLDDGLVTELVEDLGAQEFETLVRIFDQDFRRRIDQLREAIGTADMPASRRILHAMAGSSASIGAVALAALCRSAMHADHVSMTLADQVEAAAAAVRSAFAGRGHAHAGANG